MIKSKLIIPAILLVIILATTTTTAQETAYGPRIEKDSYEISRSLVNRELAVGNIFKDTIRVKNLGNSDLQISLIPSGDITEVLEVESSGALITAQNETDLFFTITAREIDTYTGELTISGDIEETIPVNITILNETNNARFFVTIETTKKKFTYKEELDFKLDVKKITTDQIRNVTFEYILYNSNRSNSYPLGTETKDLIGSLQIRKTFNFPEEVKKGFYIIDIETTHKNETFITSSEFQVVTPFWNIKLFGFLPMWLLAIILGVLALGITAFIVIRRMIEKSKKYKMQLYTKTLPKKNDRTLWLGKVAETNLEAYLDMDALTTHAVVAGATGGGKSISAQVLIEEALKKNVAIIAFDPTAQWSGMLRKNEDKKMLSFYPKFKMKPNEARAFPGNVRQIRNERQKIDINKYMNPGQIQIFTMNKLTPPQIDVFVASVIAGIFESDPKEYQGLKCILIFDEVHRLLPKFGGSGKGFLQIERACREFRKWGLGVMLVSQVLSDFVGEIKANINTEVQMRTRDEADLNRIKTKYGEEFLQSLIKASVGVGMFVQSKYNKGKPYFVNFRPILHSTRRLSDEVLEQYNKYGETIEDIEFQIEQLEKEKVDTFDLKMELKLVKDKLMSGNFTVVDIYLEGLKPRVEKQWETIGKKPKKREIELVDTTKIDKSLEEAQKGRDEFEKNVKGGGEKGEEKKEGEGVKDKSEEGEEKKEESKEKPAETPKEKEEEKPKEEPKKKETKKEEVKPAEKKDEDKK
jgi:hypothetical protein